MRRAAASAAHARALILCLLATLPAASAHATGPAEGAWNFSVLLDDTLIGTHHFSLATVGGERQVASEAQFNVRFFGIVAYRYRHLATEQWQGDCLKAFRATTDDDGEMHQVQAALDGGQLHVVTDGTTQRLDGCVMGFAYWNPAIQSQTRLLNVQTGQVEQVQLTRGERAAIAVRGQQVMATRWRIAGPARPLDVWYSDQGEWLGLDATVRGGRRLSYRLR